MQQLGVIKLDRAKAVWHQFINVNVTWIAEPCRRVGVKFMILYLSRKRRAPNSQFQFGDDPTFWVDNRIRETLRRRT